MATARASERMASRPCWIEVRRVARSIVRMDQVAKFCQYLPSLRNGGQAVATMNVSLPDPMKEWVEAQARSGRYSNASDYVRDLIRRDQDRAAKIAEMQRLVTEGLESGVGDRSMAELRDEARGQHGAAKP